MLAALAIGFCLGFLGSMPVAGPVAAIVLERGLDHRRRPALLLATGAAVAESLYAFMAFWGLSVIIARFPVALVVSRIAASAILVGLGFYFAAVRRRTPSKKSKNEQKDGLSSAVLGFSMTAFNPTLIVTWSTAVGIAQSTGLLRSQAADAFPFAGGAGLGIVSWFALMLALLERVNRRVGPKTLDRLVRGVGVALIVLGLGLGVHAIASRHEVSPSSPRSVS